MENILLKSLTKYNLNKVNVLEYLPTREKIDLIDLSIKDSIVGTTVNQLLLQANFFVNLVMCYTDIELTEEEKDDKIETYDYLISKHIIEEIIKKIPDKEYKFLYENLTISVEKMEKELNSILNLFSSFIEELTNIFSKSAQNLEGLDSDKLKELIEIAKNNGVS